MASAREDHAASVLPSGKVLLVGGYKNVNPFFLASAELFDPAGNAGTGAFVATGSMGTTRRQPSATVLSSGKVLVVGGSSFGVGTVASAEVFDPAGNSGAGSFVDTASMGTARILHTATALASGKVLIAGGKDSGGWLAAAEVFDPAGNSGAGTFAATGSMAAPRGYHTASLLPSGLVVVAGGQASAYLASAEVFDPAANAGAGAFVATAAMASARAEQTANTLSSGRIVAVGGNSSAGCLASAELYGGALGDPCSLNAYCLSGFCASGVCCDAVCNGGSCQRCDLNGKEGKCTIAPSGNPGAKPPCAFPLACDGVNPTCPPSCATDASCAPSYYCGSNGTCQPRKAQGVACNPQSDCKEAGCQECTAGTCADGVCCDRACSGQCEACDAVAGVCSPIAGKPHGARPDCPSGKACGTSTNACEVGAGTCDGDHTAKAADGTTKDCAPYKCESSGTCRPSCASVNDCVAPTICDSTGKCVGPAAAGNDGGCAIAEAAGAAGDESSRLAWLAVAAGLVLAQLWRRRRAGGATLSKRFSEEEINRFREGGRG
jgi:hypothetical protein